jgi:hypothetical protein
MDQASEEDKKAHSKEASDSDFDTADMLRTFKKLLEEGSDES